ncbi:MULTISPECIES: hypothetical protein [Enterococcus]|uniref:Primosomal protein N n=1 Tax=Candidatus Enterococcus mangumiae TaxID=2230878 RepID=A0ABZ2SSA3_9ENTE|nr:MULTISPECIES: hypothetical protein [unclassified Enterococcus]MBO0460751.1 hypothetical protein [Enterococcus sp. DIV1298c]MBO0488779.1 hypothetical protein [Enterococcus sp. DIV1094]MBO1299069.1 hypothetical protein [Enterococcus sp. DIV1271a]
MLDDQLKCPNCQTKFYYNEVSNVVEHQEKEMPIRCPECNEVVKKKLSHGYFVTYKETDFSKLDDEVEETPKQYKNLKTGAVISAEEYQQMIQRHDLSVNGPMSSELMGGMNMLIENEELNEEERMENYVPYD